VQAANFVYGRDGAYPPHLILGYSNNIEQRSKGNLAVSFMIVGCLLSAFLYHLGLFCLNRSRKTVLVFSLCCLLLATMNKKLILLLFPQYNWFVVIRIEYVVHFLTFAMLVLFLEMLHPRLLHRAVTRVYYALALGYILSTLMLDSTVFTGLLSYFEAASALMICYVVVRLAMALRRGKLQIWLSFAGVLVLGLLGMNDMLYFRGIMSIAPIAGQFFMTPIGMVFFVCCYSMVLSIEYAQIEREMLDAREKQQQLAAENTTLDRVNRMKTDLMTTISHEARTPLAVMASYSGLVSMELRAQGVDAQTAADLDQIVFEAKRVADLIDSMKRLVLRSEETSRRVPLNIAEIASQTARLYQPILERTGVELLVEIPETAPVVLGSPEELTQVFFNLLQNAKNHTPTGWVTVTLTSDGEAVTTSIANTGASIPAEIMPHLFEKGVRGDKGGDGLGLAICKEIVENHDGTITLVSEPGIGTTVTFILPAYHEGRTDGN
ncbi:MAG: sensor histidine kinase, partial [Propionibacteriaceae bacterium]|jgi:signal transduction histidine kinase|nr:sensor histidine kinase [Propionibacteriaceae bacterium]